MNSTAGNIAVLRQRANANGFALECFVTSAHMFFLPQTRWRIIIVLANWRRLGTTKENAEMKLLSVKTNMQELAKKFKHECFPLQSMFLPRGDNRLDDEEKKLQARWAKAIKEDRTPVAADDEYLLKHKAVFDKYNIPWKQPSSFKKRGVGKLHLDEDAEATNIWYASLPDREKLNLYFCRLKFPAASDEDRKRVFILTRSLERLAHNKPRIGVAPCVKPLDKMWLDWLGRYALAEEKMALQGHFLNTYDAKSVNSTTLASLAGNTIPTTLCSALNHCLMAEFGDAL
jgi:site-specific DNA-cytosine methylase